MPIPTDTTYPINYSRLSRALAFYKDRGYVPIEAPWAIPKRYTQATAPSGAPIFRYLGQTLVASAEQSFLYLVDEDLLPMGRYCTLTPCFRNEPEFNNLYRPYFMKVELFAPSTVPYSKLMFDAQDFMAGEGLSSLVVPINITSSDLYARGVELGSYGHRSMHLKTKISWSYGTGLAEPRFSEVLKLPLT